MTQRRLESEETHSNISFTSVWANFKSSAANIEKKMEKIVWAEMQTYEIWCNNEYTDIQLTWQNTKVD